MAVEVGSAYISIIPSLRGFGSSLQSGIGREMADVANDIRDTIAEAGQEGGQQAGENIADGLTDGASGGLSSLGGALKAGALAAGVVVGAALVGGIAKAMENQQAHSLLAAH
jgi:hypothetical protein